MGLTEFVKKQTPHFSGVVVLGVAAYCGPMFLTFGIECKAMAKNKDLGNFWIEFAAAVGLSQAAGFNGLFLWMNQSWGRHLKERDETLREVREEKRLKNGSTAPPIPNDPNLR